MNTLIRRTLVLSFLLISYFASAQTNGTVTGKVISGKDKSAVDYASIAVKRLSDSTTVGTATTSASGTFTFSGLAPGKYKLYVVYIGYKSINKDFELTTAKPSINFGSLIMEDGGITLSGVEIKGEIPPVVVKKDTLEFNASTIKVKENAVVEDLLKKLPGVDVAKDGSITTQGEAIKRVRVDGKDFMGTDPLLATRNLPADMVDKIQIIDDMSDQAKFSGVDDGNREKIINITTKKDKKKGYFGNSTLGYGTDDRYDVNLNVNKFNNDQQISLIGQFNNINKQNFGGGVGGGGGGGGGGRTMTFGGGGGGAQQGITTTNAAGVNFADVYKNQTTVNGSYFFNKTSLFNTNNSFTQNLLGNVTTTNNSDLNSTTERLNHRLNFTIDTKIDSTTSIRIQPSVSYSDNTANSLSHYNRNVLTTNTIGTQNYQTNSTSPSISNSLLIRKKFQRRGRTLSLNLNTNINNSDANNYNYILDQTVFGSTTTQKLTNQLNDNNSHALNNTTRLVYTEPLSKTLSLELNYQNGYSIDNSERGVYNFNTATQQFDLKDLTYSNQFENTTLTNSVGFSFNKTQKKYNWNLGLAVQNTDRKNVNETSGLVLKQNFINLTPQANFRYNFSTTKRLNIRYNGRTQQPGINQIQPIPDNTNTQSIILGNPDLKPAFVNTLAVFYNNFDFASYRTLFFGTFINQSFNAIASSQRLITNPADINYGKIATSYVNVDGNFTANAFGNLSQPIIKGNKLTLQINASGSFGKSSNITTDLLNVTKDYSLTNGYKFVSNVDKFDLIAGISGTINRSTYSATPKSNTKYYTIAPNIDISYVFPGNIRLQADVTYNKVTGRGAGFDTEYTLINSYISRQFFKNRGTFKVAAYDMLNQNTGVSRSSSSNTISDINYNVLKRYYMFSFTYSLNKVGGKTMSADAQGGGRPMMMMRM